MEGWRCGIILVTQKNGEFFATDLGQLSTAESENNIRFSQSGQVFMLSRFFYTILSHLCYIFCRFLLIFLIRNSFLKQKKSFSTPLHLLHVTKINNCTLNSRH